MAEVPPTITYQGILTDTTGAPVEDDVYAVRFALYGDSAAGVALWETAGFVPIQTRDGLFEHVLGSTNPIPDTLARAGALWLGITVNLESEMAPRTRLASVPFAFSAQYADTATTSLDKTIDAAELVAGTLDTARFSAYADLLSENRLGPAPDQVATGDHVHTGVSFPGTMVRLEDTTLIIKEFQDYESIDSLIKEIYIPAYQIGNFFKFSFPMKIDGYPPGALPFICVIIDEQSSERVFEIDHAYSNSVPYLFDGLVTQANDSLWYGSIHAMGRHNTNDVNIHKFEELIINPEDGISIKIRFIKYWSDPTRYTVTVGNLLVEYDVD
jgi:hypothetical protein